MTAGANISLTYDDSANTLTIAATEDNLSNNDTDDLSEGSTNLYFTNARARSAISAGGDLSYNSTTGVMSFTERTDAEVRGLVSASGDLSYNSSTGAFSFTERTDAEVRGLLSASGDLSYNSSTGAFSFTQRTDAQVRGLLSASGDLSYNSSTGAFSFTERTDAEVRGLISGGTGVSYNSSTGAISIGQAVGTTNDVTFNDVTVSGDLTVSGTTTTVNTETINLADNQIVLNSNFTGSSPTENGGIEIERGTQTNKTLVWNETDDKWTVGSETFVAATFEGALTGNVTGNLTGNVTGNVTGDVTGNADTATTLATARTINGTSFDGSANISFDTDSVSEGSSNLYYTNARSRAAISASGDLSYNSSTGVISFTASAAPVTSVNTQTGAVVLDSDDIAEGSTNLYHTQERVEDIVGGMVTGNTETGITVTYQDADGTLDFEVGTLNQDTTGNAATATALETARTIGGVSFDGTSNIDLAGVNTAGNQNTTGNAATATALETARTIHGVSFDGSANIDLSEEVQDTVGAMFTGNTETGITATYQDADGTIDLVVGTLNQDTTGNAATATALETARTIGGVSFDGSANINLAGVNQTGNQDTTGNAATATALETARNFSISGDITASNVSFDGTGNVALSADIDANTVGITELNVSDGTNGQVLTTNGSGTLSFADASGGASSLNDLSDAKTFGTGSIMIGDSTTGTINAADRNTGVGVDVFASLTEGAGNNVLGYQALDANTTGNNNVAIGESALGANTTASNNVAIGHEALLLNTTGHSGVAVGYKALDANTTGLANIGIGYQALSANTTAHDNTAIGQYSLDANTTGTRNVAVGNASLSGNTTGNDNVAVGVNALLANTTGTKNVAIGYAVSDASTTARFNAYVGYGAGGATTTGGGNVGIGYLAAEDLTAGASNTFIGNQAGANTTTAGDNVAVGALALNTNTTGANNTAVGRGALRYATTASNNSAFGYKALNANTTGTYCVAIGENAGTNNTANNGVFIGAGAGDSNTSGDKNTMVGRETGTAVTTGGKNTLLGGGAGYNITTGIGNTMVGTDTHAFAATDNYSIVIGYNVKGVASGSYFTFGSSTGSDRVYNKYDANASWTRVSDERYKEEIVDNTDCGLDFINDLRPVTFKWKPKADIDNTLPDYDESKTERHHDGKMYGLIAQEVKQALEDNNITDFGGWSETAEGIQGISQEMFVHPLIKAVQELSAKCDALQARIDILEGE